MARRNTSTNLSPALLASLVLHVGAAVLVLILGMYFKKPESMGGGVPITIVSEGPPQARDAEQGDTEEVSAGEILPEPLPEPEPVAPPLPDPKPTPPTKTPPKPAPTPSKKPKADLDFDRLLADVQGSRRPPRTQPGGGGGTGKKDRTLAVGTSAGPSAGAKGYLLTLGSDLGRRWTPNCLVEGGADVKVTVRFTVAPSRTLLAPPKSSADGSTSSMILAAGDRAKRAVWAADYDTFPPELFGEELIVPFDDSVVCGKH